MFISYFNTENPVSGAAKEQNSRGTSRTEPPKKTVDYS